MEVRIHCAYIASNADMVRRLAKLGGFPANRVPEVRETIDPITAE